MTARISDPVFIVGMNGSGTTMVLDCLSRNSKLCAFPHETRCIPHLAAIERNYTPLSNDENFCRFWAYISGLTPFVNANGGKKPGLPDEWKSCPRDLAGIIDLAIRQGSNASPHERWCEKSPQYAQHMPLLSQIFPTARFVHIIRDGRDCARSFHRRWGRSPALTVYQWKKLISLARQQSLTMGDRYIEVKFEDLTAEPKHWLKVICSHLGIQFEPTMLDSSQPYLNGGEKSVGIVPNSRRYRAYFSASQQLQLECIAGATLKACGYTTQQPHQDQDPTPAQIAYWKTRDAAYQWGREIFRKATGRLDRPWRIILGRPIDAVRNRGRNVF